MAERFSQKNLRVRPSSDEEKIVTNAKKHFEKTLVESENGLKQKKKLNYGEIFKRQPPVKNLAEKVLNANMGALIPTVSLREILNLVRDHRIT